MKLSKLADFLFHQFAIQNSLSPYQEAIVYARATFCIELFVLLILNDFILFLAVCCFKKPAFVNEVLINDKLWRSNCASYK